jgi:hypothetical protein
MSATVQNLSGEIKRQVESRLDRILEGSDHGHLTVSPICAHVILESAISLKAKEDAQSVLSSTTIFLTAVLFSIRLADEGLPDIDAAERDEQARLQKWGLVLRDEYREVVESLVGEFFATRPRPARNVFENIAEEPPSGIGIGPGLARMLDGAAEAGALTTPAMLLRLARDEQSGIAERLRAREAQSLTDALTTDPPGAATGTDVPEGWRHAQMFREAEEDELVLGVRNYARAIATVLRTAKGEFTFALLGRWGSGKTTLVSQLIPLLLDARVFRNSVGIPEALRQYYVWRSYRVVMHNAWKYRSRPEAWVYAYKSLADEAARSFGPIGRVLLAIRTSVHRRGIWPIAGALMMLALLALPLTAKLQLAAFAVSVAGFSTMLYLGAVTTSVSGKVRALFAKHLRLTQVDERLGMLALVGDDVRALLAGWTYRIWGDRDDRGGRDFLPGRLVLPLIALALVAAIWAFGLLRSGMPVSGDSTGEVMARLIPPGWAEAIGPLQNARPTPASTAQWTVFALWLVLAFAMLVLPWLARRGRPNRVLMVIDDLDRCSASEMLDVIEGMKLLVDDSTVNRRLQVMMLVDESVLNHAIALRYSAMIEERIADVADDARKAASAAARDEVITEQNEKLFACHLRLAPLSRADVELVVASLAGREQRLIAMQRYNRAQSAAISAEEDYQRVSSGAPQELFEGSRGGPDGSRPRLDPETNRQNSEIEARNFKRAKQTRDERLGDSPEIVRKRDETATALEEAQALLSAVLLPADSGSPTPAPSEFRDVDARFTVSEVEDLRRQVPPFLEALKRRPSPRAIRILLFKVQLCRLLLQLRNPREPGERTVAKILEAFSEAIATPVPTGPERPAITFARQVI